MEPESPMIARLIAAAAVLAFCVGSLPAHAQEDDDDDDAAAPLVVQIQGPCALTIAGRPQTCQGLAYMVFPENQRKDFTVLTSDGGWAFSGQHDARTAGRYSLMVDSVLRPGTDRMDADGLCTMTVGGDGSTVEALSCDANTRAGRMTLQASGQASADDRDGSGDDQDDDDDQRPDNSGRG
jgi:hypothetical protein